MQFRVGGIVAALCLISGLAQADVISGASFGSSGPDYWNNPSGDGTGCYNGGCLAAGQFASVNPLNSAGLLWATTNASGLGDFSFVGNGTHYTLSVLSNLTANSIVFGIYDTTTNVKTALYQGNGYSGSVPQGDPNTGAVSLLAGSTAFSQTGNYGFYITVNYACSGPCPPNLSNTYFSESSKNTTYQVASSAFTAQHFAAFQTSDGYVIGAADTLLWNGITESSIPGDYNDIVVKLTTVTEAPEPASLALIGVGLSALAVAMRKRR